MVARASTTHSFVSAIADDATAVSQGEVVPSKWNAAHVGVRSVYNVVVDYGAVGDGATDETTAINAAITAFNVTGGVLYFPKGTYLVSNGNLTTLTANGIVVGDGSGTIENSGATVVNLGSISQINCNSSTNPLFTVNSLSLLFQDLAITNISGTTPTSGASGIIVTSANLFQTVNYDNIVVSGFYINIDVQVGDVWRMHNCTISNIVEYGVRIQNTVSADAGDWFISNCVFWGTTSSVSAIKLLSSGGGKITNCKVNAVTTAFTGPAFDLTMTGSSILLIANCSIENFGNIGINLSGYNFVVINGIELEASNSTSSAFVLNTCAKAIITNIVCNAGGGGAALIDTTTSNSDLIINNIAGCPDDGWTGGIIKNNLTTNIVAGLSSIPGTVGVSGLPSAGLIGRRMMVNNSNATMTAGIGAVVASGGSNVVPVYDDGTNWRIG